jgi:hypothetical protein
LQLARVAEIVALPSLIAVHESVDEALATSVDGRQPHECGSS